MECYRQSNIYWHDSPTNSAGFPLVLTQPGEDTAPEGYDAFLKSMEEDLENDCSPSRREKLVRDLCQILEEDNKPKSSSDGSASVSSSLNLTPKSTKSARSRGRLRPFTPGQTVSKRNIPQPAAQPEMTASGRPRLKVINPVPNPRPIPPRNQLSQLNLTGTGRQRLVITDPIKNPRPIPPPTQQSQVKRITLNVPSSRPPKIMKPSTPARKTQSNTLFDRVKTPDLKRTVRPVEHTQSDLDDFYDDSLLEGVVLNL